MKKSSKRSRPSIDLALDVWLCALLSTRLKHAPKNKAEARKHMAIIADALEKLMDAARTLADLGTICEDIYLQPAKKRKKRVLAKVLPFPVSGLPVKG